MNTTFHSLEWTHQIRDAEIPPALKLLGLAMMTYANRAGLARPTVDQLRLLTPKNLEADTSAPVSESTLKRRRRKLVALGWIQLHEKGNGPGQGSIYRLAFPPGIRVWKAPESGSESGSEYLLESGSGQTHQERHQEQQQDQVQANGSPRPLTLRSGYADFREDEEDLPPW